MWWIGYLLNGHIKLLKSVFLKLKDATCNVLQQIAGFFFIQKSEEGIQFEQIYD